jgi:hypothetical protein
MYIFGMSVSGLDYQAPEQSSNLTVAHLSIHSYCCTTQAQKSKHPASAFRSQFRRIAIDLSLPLGILGVILVKIDVIP